MADILSTGIVVEIESLFKSDGIDAVIKKLYDLEKASLKVGESLDFNKFGDEIKTTFKKTALELDSVYEDFNKKLAAKDVKFAAFRNEQVKSGLNFTEKEIKVHYDKVVGLHKTLNAELEKSDVQAANKTKTLLGKTLSELQTGIKGHIQTLTGISGQTLSLIGSSTSLAVGGVAAAIAFGTVKLAQLGAEAELTKAKFNSFLNSTAKTNKLDDELDNIAKKTGISGDVLNEAALSLLKFGIEAEKIPNKLNQINSIAAKLGIPIATLAEQLGRIEFKNFANKFDLKTLEKEGIPIFQELAAVTGKTTDQLRKLARVSSEDVSKALDHLTGAAGSFGSVLDDQSKTFSGSVKTIVEQITILGEDVGEAFIPAAKSIIDSFKFVLDAVLPIIKQLSSAIGSVIDDYFFEFKSEGAGFLYAFSKDFDIVKNKIKSTFGGSFEQSLNFGGENFAFGQQLNQQLALLKKKNNEIDAEIERVNNSRGKLEDAFLNNQLAKLRSQRVDLGIFATNSISKFLGVDNDAPKAPDSAEINAANEKLIEQRKKILDQLLKLQLDFRDNQIKIGRNGLFNVESFKDENDVSNFQEGVLKKTIEIQKIIDEANNLGVKLPVGFKLDLEEQFNILRAQLNQSDSLAFIKKLPVRIGKIEFQDKNGKKLDVSKQIAEINTGFNFDNKTPDPDDIDRRNKGSKFLELLFGSDKEQQDKGEKALKSAQESIKLGLNLFFEAEIKKTDFLIEQQKKRIAEVNKVAALGNAEQLQIEENRLRKLEEKREQSVRRQNAINALQVVSQTALAVSSFATAITKQAVQEHPVTAIAEGVALLAAVFAGIAQIKSLSQGFYEGTEYVDQKGHHRSGIDTVPSMLTRGERVLTVQQNEALGGISNDNVVKFAKIGRIVDINTGSSIYLDPNKNYSDQYQRQTVDLLRLQNEKLDRNTEAINNTFVDIRFHDNGWRIAQTQHNRQEAKRSKIFS